MQNWIFAILLHLRGAWWKVAKTVKCIPLRNWQCFPSIECLSLDIIFFWVNIPNLLTQYVNSVGVDPSFGWGQCAGLRLNLGLSLVHSAPAAHASGVTHCSESPKHDASALVHLHLSRPSALQAGHYCCPQFANKGTKTQFLQVTQ